VELNDKGEEVWSCRIEDPQTVQRLKNGNTVIWQPNVSFSRVSRY
jgi:hypothetical protein